MPDQARPGSLSSRLAATTRVLAIEDDPDIADFLRAYFRASGYDAIVLDPASVAEAVAAVEEHQPDAVLLDMMLRGFSGLDVYRRLRSDPRHSTRPVVVVTADVTARARVDDTASGIDGFVAKPFNVNTLAQVVAERIAASKALGDLGDPFDASSGILAPATLRSRMNDELHVARATGQPLSFAIVRLKGSSALRAQVGESGLDWLLHDVVADAQIVLPAEANLGITDDGDLAVLLPDTAAAAAARFLERALGQLRGHRQLPGGADVAVDPVAGIAAYPEHATDADGLFMAADAALADAVDADLLVGLAE